MYQVIHTRQSGISLMLRSMGQKSVLSYFGNACKSSLLVAGKGERVGGVLIVYKLYKLH